MAILSRLLSTRVSPQVCARLQWNTLKGCTASNWQGKQQSRALHIILTPNRIIVQHSPLVLDKFPVSTLLLQTRHFKPPNSFVNHKESVGADLLEKCLMFVVVAVIVSLLIDFRAIWDYILPKSVKERIEKSDQWVLRQIRQLFKKADALGKDVPPSDESKVIDSSRLYSLFSIFNINRDNDSKVGGFRDKKIIEYENRIRLYSNPDKIFRYFATVKIVYSNKESEIYMTPDDFLRALTPGLRQPHGYGLDQFKVVDLSKNTSEESSFDMSSMLSQLLLADKSQMKQCGLKPDSIFYRLSKFGLINFSDFLFLLTVISVSKRHFEIAFRMFDLNGDGDVEYEEFAKVQNAILAQTSIGKKMGKSLRYKGISSAVSKYFFGEDLKQRLTIEHFIEFQQTLQQELLTLEFERKNPSPVTGRIDEGQFAELLVAYAVLSEKKRKRMTRRVMKKFTDTKSIGISLEEYLNFFRFLQNINDVDIALAVYHIAGASIDQATLKHVAQTVAHVELSDHLVDVVFTLFDEDEDGQLSNKEFISVMKERLRRGLSKPKDTGFLKIMYTIWKSLTTLDL